MIVSRNGLCIQTKDVAIRGLTVNSRIGRNEQALSLTPEPASAVGWWDGR
jgi:hypothetical protein